MKLNRTAKASIVHTVGFLVGLSGATLACAATQIVNSTSDDSSTPGTLPYAMLHAAGGDTIDCSAIAGQTITLTSSLPAVGAGFTLNGAGIVIDGAGNFQAFQVASGTVVINGVTVQNALSKGGDGGDGYSGGGGAVGGGGALYVHGGTSVTLTASSVLNNTARGGNGGSSNSNGNSGAGGGGGFGGGAGGSSLAIVSTGGGGGGHSNGGNGGSSVSVSGSNGVYFGGGGGGAGINSVVSGGSGGNASPTGAFVGGAESSGNGGGGAGDSQNGFAATGSGSSGIPGNGGNGIGADLLFGGGGGGGGASETGSPGGTGIGAAGGGGGPNLAGGNGGTLGGGGGGGVNAGGAGGFGAGGGGGVVGGSGGGSFNAGGGNGGSDPSGVGGGGGGSGLGGGVFVQSGANLTIVDAAQISGNAAVAGLGGGSTNAADPGYVAAGDGAAMGEDIFVREQGTIVFDVSTALTIATPIAGDLTNGPATSGGLQKTGAGTLALNGANTYSGTTTVAGGTLNLAGSVAGSAIVNAGATLSGDATVAGDLTNAGTLAPGNTVGTMHTTNLVLNAPSVLQTTIAANGTNDLVAATGTAQLAGTLEIDLDPAANTPSVHTVLTSSGLSGSFASVTFVGATPAAYSVSYLPIGAPTFVQLTILAAPLISIAKSADTNQLHAGGTVHYTVTVGNAGSTDASGTIVADAVPAGIASQTWTCAASGGAACGAAAGTGAINDTLAAFPANASAVYSVTAIVATAPPATITNTASATPLAGGQCVGGQAPPCTASTSGSVQSAPPASGPAAAPALDTGLLWTLAGLLVLVGARAARRAR